jgi:hypothetical protein
VTPAARVTGLLIVAASLCACTGNPSANTASTVADTIPAPTIAITGTPGELLPEMAVEMSRLSSQISGVGDERVSLSRIDGIWAVIQQQIQTQRPDLFDGMQTTIDLATSAVERNRPADADKAARLLGDLVDSYDTPS